jgi:hypothetical protein
MTSVTGVSAINARRKMTIPAHNTVSQAKSTYSKVAMLPTQITQPNMLSKNSSCSEVMIRLAAKLKWRTRGTKLISTGITN